MDRATLRAACAVALLASTAGASDLIDFSKNGPEVRFDLPRSIVAHHVEGAEEVAHLATGEHLLMIELPVSVLVRKGDVSRVREIVIEVDGATAGLTVHDYAPATRLESEFTRDIEVQSTTENDRHLEASLGGRLPIGGVVAQITPGVSAGRATTDIETEKLARRPPKQAIVVSGPINQRQGVLFKFRPSSQTTLEGEHQLRLTFVAPRDWQGGYVDVHCHAAGERKVLFVKQATTWGDATERVALRLPGKPRNGTGEEMCARHTTAKPAIEDAPAERPKPTATGPIWKPRKQVAPAAEFSR